MEQPAPEPTVDKALGIMPSKGKRSMLCSFPQSRRPGTRKANQLARARQLVVDEWQSHFGRT